MGKKVLWKMNFKIGPDTAVLIHGHRHCSELVSVDQIKNNHQSVPRKRRVFLFCEQRNKLWNHCIPLCTNGLYSLRCPLFAPWNMSQPASQAVKQTDRRRTQTCVILHDYSLYSPCSLASYHFSPSSSKQNLKNLNFTHFFCATKIYIYPGHCEMTRGKLVRFSSGSLSFFLGQPFIITTCFLSRGYKKPKSWT